MGGGLFLLLLLGIVVFYCCLFFVYEAHLGRLALEKFNISPKTENILTILIFMPIILMLVKI